MGSTRLPYAAQQVVGQLRLQNETLFQETKPQQQKTMEQEQKRHCDGEGRVEGQRQKRIADTHVVSVLFSKQEKIIGNEEGTSKRERQLE